MARNRTRYLMGLAASLALHLWAAGPALANDCAVYAQHRDAYLYRTGSGMDRMLQRMAQQRGTTPALAAFYWGGTLLQSDDPETLRTLAQITLASYGWPEQREQAESAMARIFEERGGQFAGLLSGLMLSDDRGPKDPWRARVYLQDAARQGSQEAEAFLRLYDACTGRQMALN